MYKGLTCNVRDGNWITGIPVIDNALYGDQSMMPDSLRKVKDIIITCCHFYSALSVYYTRQRKRKRCIVKFIFFFTGFAIIIYINQPGFQPRERDYAYAGSFYVFAIWIGLSVLYLIELATSWNKKLLKKVLINAACLSTILMIFIMIAGYGEAAGISWIAICVDCNYCLGLPYILQF